MFEVEAGFLSTPNLDSTILNSEYLVCDEYSHISEIKLSKEYGKQTIVQMYALLWPNHIFYYGRIFFLRCRAIWITSILPRK